MPTLSTSLRFWKKALPVSQPSLIHPTAIVDPNAKLARDVEVGPYSIVGPGVTIGSGSRLGSHVRIVGNTRIGKRNRFFHACSVGEEAQDLKEHSENGLIKIGDDNVFREQMTVHRPGSDDRITEIGNRCYLMVGSHVAHDCKLGDSVIIANNTALAGFVHLGDGAFLSAFVGIHQHCKIGKLSMIGALTKVVQDIPPFVTTTGIPAKANALNTLGMKRMKISPDSRSALKKAFKALYLEGASVKNGVALIKERLLPELREKKESHRLVSEFAEFVSSSERGVIGYGREV